MMFMVAILIMMSEHPSMILKKNEMARNTGASSIIGRNETRIIVSARRVKPI